MTEQDLADELAKMYRRGLQLGQRAWAMVHLFGIKYADELKRPGISIQGVCELARYTLGRPQRAKSLSDEVSKMVTLSEYVEVRPDYR